MHPCRAGRNDHLAIADDGSDQHAVRHAGIPQRAPDQPRALLGRRLDHLAEILPERIEGRDRAVAHMAQNGRDRDGARADDRIDAQGRQHVLIGGLVHQGDGPGAALALGQNRGEDVRLVIVGDGDDRLGTLDIGLDQHLLVEGIALDHHGGVAELAGDELGPLPRMLDHLERDVRGITGDPAGQVQADIAAAHDHDAAGDLLLVAEKAS